MALTKPALYTPVPLETLAEADHQEGLHETDRTTLRELCDAIGVAPSSGDLLEYVRLSDGAGKGLWVPAEAVVPGLIIDGNFDVWQQNLDAAATHTTTYNTLTSYGPDMFFCLPAGASITSQRSTSVPNVHSQSSWQLNGASSVTTVDLGQRILANRVVTRGKQTLLFSCYVYNGSGAAFTPNLRIGTPGAADDFTTVTNRLDQALQSCADSAWTRVYHVFDPSAYTNIANGMECVLRIPSGSLVSGDTVRIAQFDLRPWVATAALPPFLPVDPSISLLIAKTQFQKNVSYSTAIGTTGSSVAAKALVAWTPVANGERFATVNFPTPFRIAPTITVYPCTTVANTSRVSDSGATDYAAGSGTPIDSKDTGFSLQNVTGSDMTISSKLVQFNWYARARP